MSDITLFSTSLVIITNVRFQPFPYFIGNYAKSSARDLCKKPLDYQCILNEISTL